MSTEAEKQGKTVNPVEIAQEAAVKRQRIKNPNPRPEAKQVTERVKATGASESAPSASRSTKTTAKKAAATKNSTS